jgi:hypothetical protein
VGVAISKNLDDKYLFLNLVDIGKLDEYSIKIRNEDVIDFVQSINKTELCATYDKLQEILRGGNLSERDKLFLEYKAIIFNNADNLREIEPSLMNIYNGWGRVMYDFYIKLLERNEQDMDELLDEFKEKVADFRALDNGFESVNGFELFNDVALEEHIVSTLTNYIMAEYERHRYGNGNAIVPLVLPQNGSLTKKVHDELVQKHGLFLNFNGAGYCCLHYLKAIRELEDGDEKKKYTFGILKEFIKDYGADLVWEP